MVALEVDQVIQAGLVLPQVAVVVADRLRELMVDLERQVV
jgi:hypothetical protein